MSTLTNSWQGYPTWNNLDDPRRSNLAAFPSCITTSGGMDTRNHSLSFIICLINQALVTSRYTWPHHPDQKLALRCLPNMRCWGPIWDPCASKQGICIKAELLRSAAKAVEQWLAMEPFACQMCWEPQVIVQAASVGETWMLSELLQGMVYLHKCALFEQTPNWSWMDHCLLMILDATYYCQIINN